jgi:hypothetical protein
MKLRISIALVVGLASVSGLQANNLAPACGTNTLLFYEGYNADSQCSVGVLNFQGFIFDASGTGDATLLNASQIEVTPDPSGTLGGGFSFSAVDPSTAPFAVGANQSATYFIDWFFVIDPGPQGMSANLDLDPPFGDVSITQSYCADGTLDGRDSCSPGFQTLGVSSPPCVDPVNDPSSCMATLIFSPAIMNFAEVTTTIMLTGSSTGGAGFDSLSGAANVINTTSDSSTPEPVTVFLGLSGLVAIGVVRKYRSGVRS